MSSVEWESSEQSLYANTGVRSRDVSFNAVVFENRLRSLDLFNVLLTVVNGQRAHILLAVLLDGKRKTGRAVYAAAAQDHSLFAHRLSTFSGYRSWWVRRSNATSSQRVPGLP